MTTTRDPAAGSDRAVGSRARQERAEAADRRVRDLWETARPPGQAPDPAAGLSVVALGGYGRRELSPASDLDLLVVHGPSVPADVVAATADRIFYPLWDGGHRLDHAVRRIDVALEVAGDDVRSAMSLLDTRHVAGDPELSQRLRTEAGNYWRRKAPTLLPAMHTLVRARAEQVGELAQLAEPDLKESYGGLRDAVVLRGLVASWLVDIPHQVVEPARERLLDIRDAVHAVAGRPTDRLVAEVAERAAALLGVAGRDALLHEAYLAGRALAHAANVTWRRVDAVLDREPSRRRWLPQRRGPALTSLAPGVAVAAGEVVLAQGADPEHDPVLGLTAAAAAARAGLPLSAAACARLGRSSAVLPEPWPTEARQQLAGLLGSGVGLLDVWEGLDQAGVIRQWLPEWDRVRMLPPQNAVHRFTVDRHSLEACVRASELVGSVRRPDLLAVAALLHDIGKGHDPAETPDGSPAGADGEITALAARPDHAGTDHCGTGAPIAHRIARRWGFDEDDAETIRLLVAGHLDLPVTATTRDIADPVTVDGLANRAGDRDTLDLLHALAIADARATGPHASSAWRLTLIDTLAEAVRDSFTAGRPSALPRHRVDLPTLNGGVGLHVEVVDGTESLVIAVPDTLGALAVVSGVLSLEGFGIVRALAYPYQPYGGDEGADVWLSEWMVTGADGIDQVRLRERVAVALADGGARVNERLARRDGTAADPVDRRRLAQDQVVVVPEASTTATVLEIRAADRPGLLHRVSRELAARRIDVRSAHDATHGAGVVDVFYVTGADGRPLPRDLADRVARELTAVLRGESAAGG